MDKYEVLKKLIVCFPNSFINDNGEFIAHRYANEWFNFESCSDEIDVKYKILSNFSRGAYKTQPYRLEKNNVEFHQFMLSGINEYLGTNFTENDMDLIYTYFGFGCNKDDCYEFIRHNYDMGFFAKYSK